MTPVQWQQIKTIVKTALEIEPEKRACFVAENCSDDKFLQSEVESLLDSYENTGEFIQTPSIVGKLQILETNNFDEKFVRGRRISHYKISSEKHLQSGTLTFTRPEGGLYLWCQLRHDLKGQQLFQQAINDGVIFRNGEMFYPDDAGSNKIRFCFTGSPINKIE